MKRPLRLILLLVVALMLVVVPALLISWAGAPRSALGQTVPAPPTGTAIPTDEPPPAATPAATPTLRPTGVPPQSPLPTPRATPRTTPRPGADGRVRIGGVVLARAIGDRRSNVVYGITERGRLYRSDDNGIYWESVTDAPQVTDFIISPANPSLLYSSLPLVCESGTRAAGPILISDDGGLTWSEVQVALEPLWAAGDDAERALAAGCEGIYESRDGGATWAPLATADDDPLWETARAVEIEDAGDLLYALLQQEGGASLVAVSNDGGARWTVISPAELDEPFAAAAIAVDPATVGRLWAASPQGIWVTEDMGQFWGLSANGLAPALESPAGGLHDLAFHPRELLFVASDAGFYSKRTGDLPWRKLGSETVNLRIESLLLTESAPRRLWLNTEIGVYRFLIR